mmetsp:Transcript_21306/g.54588  ORF Transcript_21306/g.54588 Transcript_21306/m.54588 type:complete len:244 (+) Transcript_21306:38-769(+)
MCRVMTAGTHTHTKVSLSQTRDSAHTAPGCAVAGAGSSSRRSRIYTLQRTGIRISTGSGSTAEALLLQSEAVRHWTRSALHTQDILQDQCPWCTTGGNTSTHIAKGPHAGWATELSLGFLKSISITKSGSAISPSASRPATLTSSSTSASVTPGLAARIAVASSDAEIVPELSLSMAPKAAASSSPVAPQSSLLEVFGASASTALAVRPATPVLVAVPTMLVYGPHDETTLPSRSLPLNVSSA